MKMSRSGRSVEWQLTEAVVLDDLARIKELVALHGLQSEGFTLLLDAVKLGRTQIVRYLVEKGAKVNSDESDLDTPLHIAVANGDLALVETLLHGNAVVDGTEGSALLLKAVKLGNAEIVKYLLDKGAKVNSVDSNGDTPLHFAVKTGDLALIQTLLRSNAAVNAPNLQRETPLHIAAEKGDENTIRFLLLQGAHSSRDESNLEPLHLACFKQSVNIVELLLCARAQSGFADTQSLGIALLIAAQSGNLPIVASLLNAGADPKAFLESPLSHHRLAFSVSDGTFPVHLACEGGYLDVTKLLLEHSRELISSVQSSNNFTPLHSACDNGHLEVVCYLCNEQADPNIEATGNLTPLHVAARGGYLKIVDVLCKNGANIEAPTRKNLTPILLAAKNGHEDVVKTLLYRGAKVNTKDGEKNSLLYFALNNRSSFLTRCILEFQPDIDEKVFVKICDFFHYKYIPAYDDLIEYCLAVKHKDVREFSLLKAVCKGYVRAVRTLLAHGYSPNDEPGLLHSAVQFGHDEILELLLNAGCNKFEDSEGKSPTYFLFKSGKKSKYVNICESLMSKGAHLRNPPELLKLAVDYECLELVEWLLAKNVVRVNYPTGRWGETPLHHTVKYPNVKKVNGEERGKIARLLLEKGAEIDAQDNYGSTTLDRAVQYKALEVILVLLEFKRDFSARGVGIKTPLYYAIEFKRNDVVEKLCKNRAEVDAFEEQDALTMLLESACRGQEEAVKWLVRFDVDINAQDNRGETALHKAIQGKHDEVVAILLENDCDVNMKDHSRKTPLGVVDADEINYALRNVVVGHMLKLRAAGLPVSRTNNRLLREVWLANEVEYEEFEEDCKAEVRRMKQKKLGHLKLHDAIVKPSYSAFVTDKDVIRDLESVNFNEFPIYQGLIRKKTEKINEMNLIKKWLRVLIRTHSVLHQVDTPDLPPELWRMIVSYLDKKDTRCLVDCGEALKRQLC